MGVRLTSAVVQIFARDVRRSIGFYRELGLPVPSPTGRTRTSTWSCPAAGADNDHASHAFSRLNRSYLLLER
jgi:hypothetical protein